MKNLLALSLLLLLSAEAKAANLNCVLNSGWIPASTNFGSGTKPTRYSAKFEITDPSSKNPNARLVEIVEDFHVTIASVCTSPRCANFYNSIKVLKNSTGQALHWSIFGASYTEAAIYDGERVLFINCDISK